jgi:hypothetical protein
LSGTACAGQGSVDMLGSIGGSEFSRRGIFFSACEDAIRDNDLLR